MLRSGLEAVYELPCGTGGEVLCHIRCSIDLPVYRDALTEKLVYRRAHSDVGVSCSNPRATLRAAYVSSFPSISNNLAQFLRYRKQRVT